MKYNGIKFMTSFNIFSSDKEKVFISIMVHLMKRSVVQLNCGLKEKGLILSFKTINVKQMSVTERL